MPVHVDGAERLASTLAAAAGELARLTEGHREVAALIVRAARPPRRTGRLAGSIRVVPDPVSATVEAGARYAGAVHSGVPSRNIRPQPFLTRAVADTQTGWMTIYERAVQQTLDRVQGA